MRHRWISPSISYVVTLARLDHSIPYIAPAALPNSMGVIMPWTMHEVPCTDQLFS
jgi:hypothetical protein